LSLPSTYINRERISHKGLKNSPRIALEGGGYLQSPTYEFEDAEISQCTTAPLTTLPDFSTTPEMENLSPPLTPTPEPIWDPALKWNQDWDSTTQSFHVTHFESNKLDHSFQDEVGMGIMTSDQDHEFLSYLTA
jgi:hypothetical protein